MRPGPIFLLCSSVLAGVAPGLDLDGNGMCDVWEARYHASALAPDSDSDGDGSTNLEEAVAGTDPFDPGSIFRALIANNPDSSLRIGFPAQPGKSYRVIAAASPGGPWTPAGGWELALADELQIEVPRSGTARFYRVEVVETDSDADGVSDWAELQLAGFDRNNDDTFSTGTPGGDLALVTEMLHALSGGLLTANPTTETAYEKEATPAVITYSRASPTLYPFTLFLKTSGANDPTKSSAGPADFSLEDAAGSAVPGRLVIPAGTSTADLHVKPTSDTSREVPEQVHVAVGGSAATAMVAICDAAPIAANQRLFVAYLRPLPATGSLGSGIATILLPGDNDIATVAVTFSNLNSPVNSTQVQTIDSAILQSVPPFAYGGQAWPIRASQSYLTDQAVLDALFSGDVELSVFTEAFVSGEIKGPFESTDGSTEFQEPPPPPPVESLTGTPLERDIVRFLTQASFGPTTAEISALHDLVDANDGDRMAAFGAWIDQQFALPSPSLLDYTIAADRQAIEIRLVEGTTYYDPSYTPSHSNRRRGWWLFARHAPDQLRQRAAFALSQIFVISDNDSLIRDRPYGAAHYYDMLLTGASGTYRELLEGVATHPMMGHYLSHLRNSKATLDGEGNIIVSPDENFARELMQLFSIGLVQLHPDGSLKLGTGGLPIATYDQEDIGEMARVFTGWSFSVRNSPSNSDTVVTNTNFNHGNGSRRRESQWTNPMAVFPAYHDTGGKSVLGLTVPAGQTGQEDLAAVLDHLAAHPNTAPFISRRLIQRFVTANPSAGYLNRVSTAFGTSGGNLAATIKAILLDPEARSLGTALETAGAGKKREPLLRYLAFLRAFEAKSELLLADLQSYGYPAGELAKFPAGTTRVRVGGTDSQLSQTPLSAPTVFNWFQPDYTPAGLLAANGLNSPELQLANENSVYQEINYHYNIIFGSSGQSGDTLPNQQEPPYNYSSSGDHMKIDMGPLEALYMAIVDTNSDGLFTNLDTTTFNNTAAIATACEAIVDHIDLLLCAGALKSQYGATPGQPRKLIIDAVASIRSTSNNSNNATNQANYMRDRIKTALWLVMAAPDSLIQK